MKLLVLFFTMHVYSWNWIFYLNCIIWCYWIRRVVLMRRSWVEAQDDWVVILSYKMWAIRSVNRVYVDNLGLTGTEETLPKFCWKFWWDLYIYIKKKKKFTWNFPMYREKGCGKIEVVTVGIRARLWFSRLCKHEKYIESCILISNELDMCVCVLGLPQVW